MAQVQKEVKIVLAICIAFAIFPLENFDFWLISGSALASLYGGIQGIFHTAKFFKASQPEKDNLTTSIGKLFISICFMPSLVALGAFAGALTGLFCGYVLIYMAYFVLTLNVKFMILVGLFVAYKKYT